MQNTQNQRSEDNIRRMSATQPRPKNSQPKSQDTKNILVKLLAALAIATAIFFVMVNAAQKASAPFGVQTVYKTKDKVEANTVIKTEEDFNNLFTEVKGMPKDKVPEGVVVDKKVIIGKQLSVPLAKGEQLIEDKFIPADSKINKIPNRREMNIKFSDFNEAVGGTLREGDNVDIVCTYKENSSSPYTTKTKIQGAYVSKAFTSDGTVAERNKKDGKPAISVNLMISANDATAITNAKNTGKIEVYRVEDSTKYDTITVQGEGKQ